MKAKVPGTTKNKLQLAQEAAATGSAMMPPNGEIGFWEFSTKIDGKRDYIELVPMRKVSAVTEGRSQLELLQKALSLIHIFRQSGPRRQVAFISQAYDFGLSANTTQEVTHLGRFYRISAFWLPV